MAFNADSRSPQTLAVWTFLLIYAGLLLGLGMALSHAGVVLALVGSAASLAMAARTDSPVRTRGLVAVLASVVVGGVLVVQYAFADLVARADKDILDDLRIPIARTTLSAAIAFQPVGSGFGTFVPIYQMFEQQGDLVTSYINHAHNDWLELWLEGGWPMVGLAVGFVAWLVAATIRAWRNVPVPERGRAVDQLLPRAASITVFLLLAHSVVDYPLRTTAVSTVFAFCCGLLVPPPRKRLGRSSSEADAVVATRLTEQEAATPARSKGRSFWGAPAHHRRSRKTRHASLP